MDLKKITFVHAAGLSTGAGIILENNPASLVGHVIQYKSHMEMISSLNQAPPLAYHVIPGYNILVKYAGVWGKGNVYSGGPSNLNAIELKMVEMAAWYFKFRIQESPSRFTRYLSDAHP